MESPTTVLLRRWHAGDEEAVQELLERHLPWIRAHVQRRLGPALRRAGDTGDFVQEALLEFLRYGPRFVVSGDHRLRGLLVRIVENVLRDEHDRYAARRRARARERPLPSDSVLDLDGARDPVTRPSEVAERREWEAWVRLALELLEPEDREVIVLRQWDELSHGEVAERLGISEDAARMRFARALPRLAEKIEWLGRGEFAEG